MSVISASMRLGDAVGIDRLADPVRDDAPSDLLAGDGAAAAVDQGGLLNGYCGAAAQQHDYSGNSDFHSHLDSLCSSGYRPPQTELEAA